MKRMLTFAALFAGTVALAGRVPGQGVAAADPLPSGSVWTGELTQTGKYKGMDGAPPKFDCKLTITEHKMGEKAFKAELYEKAGDLELTYLVEGTVEAVNESMLEKGYKVEFTSKNAKDVKKTQAFLNIPYTATLKDQDMTEGKWDYPTNTEDTTIKGTFKFSKQG